MSTFEVQGEGPLRVCRRRSASLHVRVEAGATSRRRRSEVQQNRVACMFVYACVHTCVRAPLAAAAVEGVVCHGDATAITVSAIVISSLFLGWGKLVFSIRGTQIHQRFFSLGAQRRWASFTLKCCQQ